MTLPLNLLIINEHEAIEAHTLEILREGDFEPQLLRVSTASDLISALQSKSWDIILSDFQMVGFNAIQAAGLIREIDPNVPILLSAGAIGEENVAKAMKAGVHDFISKVNFSQLVPIIKKELLEMADAKAIEKSRIELDEKKNVALEVLRESEFKFRSIFASNMIGMVFSNQKEGIVEANDAFLQTVGYTQEDVEAGRLDWDKVAPVEVNEARAKALRELEKTGTCTPYEREYLRKDGARVPVIMGASALHTKTDTSYISYVINISERKKEEKELAVLQAKEQAALEASRLKSEFLAIVSHEIRTPMNGMIGMTDLLLDMDLTPEQRELTQIVSNSCQTLLTIINDILDFSKIESGKMQLEMLDFDLGNHLAEIAKSFQYSAEKKGLSFKIETANLPYKIHGDFGKLGQVITNLINNALKFTKQGGITLKTEILKEDIENVTLSFKIIDTGIGIDETSKNWLFKPFTQAERSTTRKFGGTGLGLSISKSIVEAMGGKITFESEISKGTTFRAEITFKRGAPLAAFDETNPEKTSSSVIPPIRNHRVEYL